MHNIQSPRSDDDGIEAQIQAKGLVAPRVTPQDIEASIVSVDYVTHVTRGGSVLRWAVLNLKNGFSCTGRPSASVSPENDNEDIGKQVALANAKQEIWPLLGYALKERLASAHTL